jgi:hypothetical protein
MFDRVRYQRLVPRGKPALGGGLGFNWMRRCIRMLVPEECGY